MKRHDENVKITLTMKIDDEGVIEKTSSQYHGQLFQKETFEVLIYEEKLDEGGTIRNLMTIHPDKVTIKRSGSIKMNQQFLIDRKTESVYEHPYGSMHMETTTSSITFKPMNLMNQGELSISYIVKLNGTDERKHEFTVTYSKEDV